MGIVGVTGILYIAACPGQGPTGNELSLALAKLAPRIDRSFFTVYSDTTS